VNANDRRYCSHQYNAVPLAVARGMGVIAMKVFAEGAFFGGPARFPTVPAEVIADEKRFAKRLSALGSVELELLVVHNQLQTDGADWDALASRAERLTAEREKQLRIARLAAQLDREDPAVLGRIDAFLNELEGK
jgi:hypothetical protein